MKLLKKIFKRKIYKPKCDKLEIGPGDKRILGFCTVNAVRSPVTDYICDCGKNNLPFTDNVFSIVYSSHFLEHIEWFNTDRILSEMYRVLKPGGYVEIWVPDALKVAKTIIAAESGELTKSPDDWKTWRNRDNNPFIWAAGRMFWGANPEYPSWHKSLYTFKHLKQLLEKHGFINVQELPLSEAKNTHGWINLGVRAYKNGE